MTLRECPCGSGQYPWEVNDARGIFVTYACDKCVEEKTKGYRPEIFTNSSYGTDEPVEPEDSYGAPYGDW